MNKLLQRLTKICLVIVLAISCPISLEAEPDCIKFAAFEYPPFYINKRNKISGIAVDLIKELCLRINVEAKLELYPLKRALVLLKDGSCDGIMILIKTSERAKYLRYTDSIINVRGLIWAAADREGGVINFDRLEDLKDYRIGVTLGYSYGQKLDNLLKTMKVDPAHRDYNNYKKLMAHRIDIFPGNEIVAKGLFKMYPEFKDKFVASDKSFIEWELHMAINKKSRFISLVPQINKIFADFKREGLVDKIIRKYTE